MNPLIYALFGALAASLGTIFAKIGLKDVDSNVLTSVRGIVMAIIVTLAALWLGKLDAGSLGQVTPKQWLYIILSGAGGALSWLFFYYALAHGSVMGVTVVDKVSLLITAILALLILGEAITLQMGIGLFLITIGTLLFVFPWSKLASLFGL